tara:strand:+ start:2012 stop:2902 length:891 start_codon:yes stop_codon:yes gene_type:complete
MKKIIVTGGAGFVGSYLVREFTKKNYKVIVVDNLSEGKKRAIDKKAHFFKKDILDKKFLFKISKNCDAIFHLAAMTNIQKSIRYPKKCMEINLKGTKNVVDACILNNCNLIFASSSAVYPINYKKKITESIKTNPLSPYGISKREAEKFILLRKKKLPQYSILRFFNIYGKGQNPNSFYSSVIPKFLKQAKNNGILKINNDGNQSRDFININDVIKIYKKIYYKRLSGVFNVGSSKAIKINFLANYIVKKIGKGKIVKGYNRMYDAFYSCASTSKLRKKIKYQISYNLKKGIDSML